MNEQAKSCAGIPLGARVRGMPGIGDEIVADGIVFRPDVFLDFSSVDGKGAGNEQRDAWQEITAKNRSVHDSESLGRYWTTRLLKAAVVLWVLLLLTMPSFTTVR